MIRCPKCQNQLPENSQVCGYCGSPIAFNLPKTTIGGYEGGQVEQKKKSPKGIIITVVAVVLALAIGVVGFFIGRNSSSDDSKKEESNHSSVSDSDIANIKKEGKLIVGITDFAPMDYKENGEWVGFDADMAKEFAKYLGVEVEFKEIEWDNKILELNNGSVDCIWNGMTLADEVKAAMDCSTPYCVNSQVVVVNKSVADKYNSVEACKELNFAVEKGSAGAEMAEANGFKYTEVVDMATALAEVKAGTCDGAIVDLLMAGAMIGDGTSYADLTYTLKLNDEDYGVGFRKGSNLTAEFNKFLEEKINDGTVKTLAGKYGIADLVK